VPWPVTLEHEGLEIDAAFFPHAGRAAGLELAASALDDLIGTTLVPPTVARTIDGEEGALQLRYPRAFTEAERASRQLGLTGWCPMNPQYDLMRTFDLLTFNKGRTVDNVAYRNDFSDLVLTDHHDAFGLERTLPSNVDELAIPAALAAQLRKLDATTLTQALGRWIDSRRIRALLARRDQLLEDR
jgi:hypothetical protein